LVSPIELTVVILVAGGRWPRIAEAGVLVPALWWAFVEFWFGFNIQFMNLFKVGKYAGGIYVLPIFWVIYGLLLRPTGGLPTWIVS
jgi:hypothetical protein